MSHKKASLSSHRDKGAKKKAESYAQSELKSASHNGGSKVGKEGKIPSVNKAPYSAKDGVNKGRCVTRNEHLLLYDLRNKIESMCDEHLDDIEFFYKVLCSAKRHMPLKKLESFRNFEGDSLVISTHKFIRLYEQRYKRPPPRSTMTNNIRIAYANSICNYHITKDGVVIPGAYYNPLTDPPLVSSGLKSPPKTFLLKSSLNGAQGSVTGTDDVDNTTVASLAHTACPHAWCNGHMRIHDGLFFYCFSVESDDSRLFANHWRHGDVSVIALDLTHEESCDDCMCLACALALVHSLHLAQSAINGNNGSYTNTDDHDNATLCVKPLCKLGTHFHRAGKKKAASGAAQRIAERSSDKSTPKPVGELVKCVTEQGVPIPCCSCEKLGEKFHLPRKDGLKKCDLVGNAMVSDAEKEQGLQDALIELESEEYDHATSGAAGGGIEPPVYCVVIEQAAKCVLEPVKDETNVEVPTAPFKGIPTSLELGACDFTFFGDTEVERDVVSDSLIPTPVSSIDDAPILKLTFDNPEDKASFDAFLKDVSSWSNSTPSPRSVSEHVSLPSMDNLLDRAESRLIMISTKLPEPRSVCAKTMVYLTKLVASVDHAPITKVAHVDRSTTLTTTMTATVENSILRLFLPSSWTWKEEVYDDYDLMVKTFYNATITREVWPRLYEVGLRHFAYIPIGQYESGKQVYSYFLARLITGMQELLSPLERDFYDTARNLQTTMNTYMALSNALVLYHYQLIKAMGGC